MRPSRRVSPSLVIASFALFVALSQTSVAAPVRSFANGLITGKQIRDGSVTTRDIANRSLLAVDFKRGQLPRGATGPAGPAGAAGPAGPAGPAGAAGAAGATNVTVRSAAGNNAGPGANSVASVACDAGQRAVGGGATYARTADEFAVWTSSPTGSPTPTGWTVTIHNFDTLGDVTATAVVVCAAP